MSAAARKEPMTNVIILGAGGRNARHVTDILVKRDDINLTLLLRDKSGLRNKDISKSQIIEGDVLNFNQLKEAIAG
jgi:saccharopine dehydrogenase-like NADP-dependent oxidoreductase